MHLDRSISITKFSGDDVATLRALGRRRPCFEALVRQAVRIGLYGASAIARLDADASAGMGRLESETLLGLARAPARNSGQFRAKCAVFRSWTSGNVDETNMRAILEAALAADAARLGLCVDGTGLAG